MGCLLYVPGPGIVSVWTGGHTCQCLDWGLNSQPRHVPWPGIKPATFWLQDSAPTNWTPLARACGLYPSIFPEVKRTVRYVVTSPMEDRATLYLRNMCHCPHDHVGTGSLPELHPSPGLQSEKKINLNFFLNSGKGEYGYQFLNFVLFNQSCKQKSHLVEKNLICVSRHCCGSQHWGSSDLCLTDTMKSVVSGCKSWNQHQVGHKKWAFYGKWFKKNAEYESFAMYMLYSSNSLFLIF